MEALIKNRKIAYSTERNDRINEVVVFSVGLTRNKREIKNYQKRIRKNTLNAEIEFNNKYIMREFLFNLLE